MTNDKVITIKISEFTIVPGARHIDDGDGSAEQFFKDILQPAIKSNKDTCILLDFDGTYGYASSFISELAKDIKTKFGNDFISKWLSVKSDEDIMLKDRFYDELSKEY